MHDELNDILIADDRKLELETSNIKNVLNFTSNLTVCSITIGTRGYIFTAVVQIFRNASSCVFLRGKSTRKLKQRINTPFAAIFEAFNTLCSVLCSTFKRERGACPILPQVPGPSPLTLLTAAIHSIPIMLANHGSSTKIGN